MKRTLFLIGLVSILATSFAAANGTHAADPALADPGTKPGSLFYGLDRAGEAISMAMTFSKEGKAEKKLKHAEERLSEARALADEGKTDQAQRTEEEYEKNLDQARSFGKQVSAAAKQQDIDAVISEATSIHMHVLEEQAVDPGDVGYDAKRKAENVAVDTERDPVEKAEKQASAAGHRVNESERLAANGQPDQATQAAQDYEDELRNLSRLGDEVSDAAQQRQIQTVVAMATQHHQKVLQRVYQQVPQQAKPAISRAMNASSTGHRQAVQALDRSGGIPSGVEQSIPSTPVQGDTPLARGRNLVEMGRQDLRRGNTLLDQNDTVGAERAYREAVSHLQRAVNTLEGINNQEAQDALTRARDALSTAQDAVQQVDQYNQDTGQDSAGSPGTNQTQDGQQAGGAN